MRFAVPFPPCRCAERREAMKRITAALARGDKAAAEIDYEFMRQSAAEYALALKEWAVERHTFLADKLRKR